MENQDYSQHNGGQPLQSTPNNPAVGNASYWSDTEVAATNWADDAVPPTPSRETTVAVETEVTAETTPAQAEAMAQASTLCTEESIPVPPPFNAAPSNADIEGIYEAVNSVFEKVEKFQDIIKIQNKTIDRFSKGIVMEARKPLLMEMCDFYETAMFGIQEDDKAIDEGKSMEDRCISLRGRLDELLEVIKCTLEDNQVEIKNHQQGVDELSPYQTITGREITDYDVRFGNFEPETNAIYVTDRIGFVVKSTEVNEAGVCKVVDHILRPEEVTKIVLKKN
ncbi:MAG: hypothetical protein K2O00_03665 [Muribaculaceae bacterium]|nr:hypothetical protein [Muribaculaceae bacterium]